LNLGCHYPRDEMNISGLASAWLSIDFCEEVILKCKSLVQRPNLTFTVMDMRKLDIKDECFDIVLDFSSGDQMDEESYITVLKEVYRVLVSGGYLAIAFTDREYYKEYTEDNRGKYGDFGYTRADTPKEMFTMTLQCGFNTINLIQGMDTGRSACLVQKP
jgi:ubiquinone/menaquinone biosynthesis C-methylase UbiE